MTLKPVDVVVVGAGAAGAAVSWYLATQGIDVLCLERGGWMDPDQAASRQSTWELSRQTSHHPSPNVRRLPQDYVVEESDTPIAPLMYNGVGGSTLHWGGQFPRFRPSDFRTRSLDGVGDDWPFAYEDLEEFYDLNDTMTGVAGIAGDPANPPRSPRPLPPVPLGRGGELLSGAFDRLGWHWWPSDAALNTEEYRGRGSCNNCGPCHLHCPTRARSSTDVTYWPEAIAHGARLETWARVVEIRAEPNGSSGVEWVDRSGDRHFQPARHIVMAANGVGTARLLLASKRRHEAGLGNSSGLVGRRLMHHPTAMVTGVFDEIIDGYKGPYAAALLCQEFAETGAGADFVRGYQLQMLRSNGPLGTALGDYLPRVPWGPDHHKEFERRFARTVTLTVTSEDLPDVDNRVGLSKNTDGDGVPLPALSYRVSPNTRRMLDHGIERATEVLKEAGAVDVISQPLVRQAGFHLLGTARMGKDPTESVVDGYGRSHDLENLWVVDGSVFVTASCVNPTSTLQAIALRSARAIASECRTL